MSYVNTAALFLSCYVCNLCYQDSDKVMESVLWCCPRFHKNAIFQPLAENVRGRLFWVCGLCLPQQCVCVAVCFFSLFQIHVSCCDFSWQCMWVLVSFCGCQCLLICQSCIFCFCCPLCLCFVVFLFCNYMSFIIIAKSKFLHLHQSNQHTLLWYHACLLQFVLPHTRGSSHGQTRIIRKAYEQDFYTRMMEECYQLWAQLEREAGVKLYR